MYDFAKQQVIFLQQKLKQQDLRQKPRDHSFKVKESKSLINAIGEL